MKPFFTGCSIFMGLGLVFGTSFAQSPSKQTQKIQALMDTLKLNDDQYSLIITEFNSDRLIFDHRSDVPMNPASAMKLLITVSALEKLGPEYRFNTTIKGSEDSLCIVGGGDPMLNFQDMGDIAKAIHENGVKELRGDVVLDDTLFSQETPYNAWDFQPDMKKGFASTTSALSLNYNSIFVYVVPGKGSKAKIVLDPPIPQIEIVNRTQVLDQKRKGSVDAIVSNENGKLSIVVTGKLKRGSETRSLERSIPDPALYTGLALVSQFAQDFHGSLKKEKCGSSRVVATHDSVPLKEVIKPMNKDSNNFIAETLGRFVGEEYSCTEGTVEVCRWLEKAQIDTNSVVVDKVSGLSRYGAIPAKMMNDAVRYAMTKFQYRDDFLSSLAQGGVDGSIKGHFKKNLAMGQRIFAKTGTLDGVSTLVGVAYQGEKNPISFAFFFEGSPVLNRKISQIRAVQEQVLLTAMESTP